MSYRIKTGDGQAAYSLQSRSNTALHGISRRLIAMLTRLRVPATVALRRPRRRGRHLHGLRGSRRGRWIGIINPSTCSSGGGGQRTFMIPFLDCALALLAQG
jgi:hypothetical protein